MFGVAPPPGEPMFGIMFDIRPPPGEPMFGIRPPPGEYDPPMGDGALGIMPIMPVGEGCIEAPLAGASRKENASPPVAAVRGGEGVLTLRPEMSSRSS